MFLFQPIGLWHWGPWGWCAVTTKVTIHSIFILHKPNIIEACSFLSGLKPDATSACDGPSSNVAFVASKLNIQLYLVLDCKCFQIALSGTPTTKLVHETQGDKNKELYKSMKSCKVSSNRILRSAAVNRRFSVTAASEMSRVYWSRSLMLICF